MRARTSSAAITMYAIAIKRAASAPKSAIAGARSVAVMRRDPVEHRHLRRRLSDDGGREGDGEDHHREQHQADAGAEAPSFALLRRHHRPPHGVIWSDWGAYRGPGALIVASRS